MIPELTSRIELSNRAHTIQGPYLESHFINDFKDTDNHRVKDHRERSRTSRVVPQTLPPSLDMSLCSNNSLSEPYRFTPQDREHLNSKASLFHTLDYRLANYNFCFYLKKKKKQANYLFS